MTPREKVLSRLEKLLALTASPNEHEARRAKRAAEDHARRHRVTDAEMAALRQRSAPKVYADGGDARHAWRRNVAVAVARARGCRAHERRGRVVLEGKASAEAAEVLRRVEKEILSEAAYQFAACGYVHMPALRPVWDAIFSSEAALTLLDPSGDESPHATHGVPQAEIRAAVSQTRCDNGVPIWIFLANANNSGHRCGRALDVLPRVDAVERPGAPGRRPLLHLARGLALVSSMEPGNHATLFRDGERLPHRGDLDMFDDAARDYTWVFSCEDPGTWMAFATEDREVVVHGPPRATVSVVRNSETGEPCHATLTRSPLAPLMMVEALACAS